MLLCIFAISSVKVYAQQNIQFTQYIFNSLSVNPAYAGYKEEWFAQLALRNQWVGVAGAPKTGQASIDGLLNPNTKRMGVGFQVMADQLGPQSATSAYLNYAFRLRLDDQDTRRLSFGIGAGVSQYSLDGTQLQSGAGGSATDPGLNYGKDSEFVPDFRFGIYYSSPTFYLGASVMDLLSSGLNESLFKQENNPFSIARTRHLYLIAGTVIEVDPGLKIRPSILLKEDFKGPTSLDLNAMVIFADQFWIGGGYRTGVTLWEKDFERDASGERNQSLSKLNSFSGVAQFYLNERLRVGYSYDYMISQLRHIQNGTHEISLGLTFPHKGQRVVSPRYF